jgi:DNA-binding PadR family transcriptional regulator
MPYEFLVLHALENVGSATPQQITEWLGKFFFWRTIPKGNHTRVALKRLVDKGLVAKDGTGYFSITEQGKQYYTSKRNKIVNGPLSPSEKRILDLLNQEKIRWGMVSHYSLEEVCKKLKMSPKQCYLACQKLALKEKIFLYYFRRKSYVELQQGDIEEGT